MSDIVPNPLNKLQETPEQWEVAIRKAKTLVESGLLPKSIDTAAKAVVIMLKGKELGFETMQSLAHIHVIEGRPVLDSHGMLALIYRNCPGAVVDFVEHTDLVCKIMAARPGREPRAFSFTIEDAQRAGLLFKDNWKKHPKSMLRSRAVTLMARALFTDCIDGAVIQDEVEEIIETTPQKPVEDEATSKLTQMLRAKSAQAVVAEVVEEKSPEIPF
jgi:hypothetical protein